MLSKLKVSLLFLIVSSLFPLHGADLSGSDKFSDSPWMPNFSLFSNNFSLDPLSNVSHDWWGKSYVDDDEPKIVKWIVTTYSGDKEIRIESSKIKELSLLGKIGLPKDIAFFTTLEQLDLSETCLVSAPTFLERFCPLYYFFFEIFNECTEPTYEYFSEGITSLTSLKRLNLNSNYLTVLPNSISRLENLKRLSVGSNRLTSLPSTFPTLSRLTDLYLYSNNLSDLPGAFGKLSSLKSLNLRSNNFKSFPLEIFDLISLKELYMDDNKIKSIPTGIGNMKKLRSFTARNNGLVEFPKSILNLEKLDCLGLKQNPCLGIRSKDYSDRAYSHKDGKFHNKIEKLKTSFKRDVL